VRHGRLVVGLLLALSLSGCVSRHLMKDYEPKDPEEAQVMSTLLKIPAGINGRSVDTIMQPYAEDVYIGNFHKYLGVASASAPRTITKADLRSAYTQLFKAVKDLSLDVVNFRLTLTGDRAVAEARFELLMKMEAGRLESRQETIRNDILWRLKRTPAGWKIQEEIYD
jgi:hypothetical protein